jgi:hypothetical protein
MRREAGLSLVRISEFWFILWEGKAFFGRNGSVGSENSDKYNDGAEFSMDKLNKAVLRIDKVYKFILDFQIRL